MNAAVIYYSRSGVTKKIAEKVPATFKAETYFVEPEKTYDLEDKSGNAKRVERWREKRLSQETKE